MTSHLQSRQELVTSFSHTFDFKKHLLHVQRHPGCLRESELEAQVFISNSHSLFYGGCLYKLQQKPSPSTNLKYSVALSLSLASLLRLSRAVSLSQYVRI